MDIELRLLQCALTLADHCNFARAAKALHMSQPSLSRNIQELERRLGVSLFVRSQQGVEPTAAGLILLEHATGVIGRANDMAHEMNLLRGMQKSELGIGAGVYPGEMFLARAVGQLVRQHPAACLSIVYDNAFVLLPRLIKREFDLAVMFFANRSGEQSADHQLEVITLKPHPMFFCVRSDHPLLRRRQDVTIADIQEYPMAMPGRMPASLIKRFSAAAKQPRAKLASQSIPSIGCDSVGMIRTITLESDAVGLLPLNVLLPEAEVGRMAAFPIMDTWTKPRFSIVRLKSRILSPLGAELIRLIEDADAELAEWESRNLDALFDRKRPRTKIAKGA